MRLGLLPGLGGSLTDLARVGQLERVLDYDLRAYAEAFEWCTYVSYDPRDLQHVPVGHPLPIIVPPRFVHPWVRQFQIAALDIVRDCTVLRVLNFTGALPGVIAKRLYGTKLVVGYNYHALDIAKIHGKPGREFWLRVLRRLALRAADGVIVASAALEREVSAAGYGGYRAIVPNGVDLERFRPRETPLTWQGPVLYVGRNSTEKNLEVLGRLPGASINLWHVRDRPYAEMPDIYRAAGAFVLPSFTEGCSKALLEAMATGLPCVVSRPAAEAFVTSHHPREDRFVLVDRGYLDDPGAWAAAIRQALKHPALGAAARAYVEKHHDIRRTLYQDVEFIRFVGRA